MAETGDQAVRSEGSAATGPGSVHRVREVLPHHCWVPVAVQLFLVTEAVAPGTPPKLPVVQTVGDCVVASERTVADAAAGDRLQDALLVAVHARNSFHRPSARSPANRTVGPADEAAADSMAGAEVLAAGMRAAGNRLHAVAAAEQTGCTQLCQHPDDRCIGQEAGEEHVWRCIADHKQTEGTDTRESEEQVAAEKHRDCCDYPFRDVVVHGARVVRTAGPAPADHAVHAEVRHMGMWELWQPVCRQN